MDKNDKWIFLSHSNEDYESVRILRNMLEENSLRPIMLFLKCLEGEPDDVVFELLKKEINARPRFILCKSENSEKSYWVQKEIEYIKSLNKPYEIANLADNNSILKAVERTLRRNRVMVLESNHAEHILVYEELRKNGFDTSYDVYENMPVYERLGGMNENNFMRLVCGKIGNMLNKGYILLFLEDIHFLDDIRVKVALQAAHNIEEYADYIIPIIMSRDIELISDVYENVKCNSLNVSNIPKEYWPTLIVTHLRSIDSRKNL